MKIAIVGSGIAGLSCAWKLAERADVQLFESGSTPGGHTTTVDVQLAGKQIAVDTGFMVFNDRTYPRFLSLLSELGMESQKTRISFSVSNNQSGLEYHLPSLTGLFAQRSNLLRPAWWRFVAEIVRFNQRGKRWLQQQNDDETLNDFLHSQGFSNFFAQHYILPIGAAIWCASLAEVRNMPLSLFLHFFNQHGLLDRTRGPQWYIIPGGSRQYIQRLMAQLDGKLQVHLNTPVQAVWRDARGVTLQSARGRERFDQIIFACHTDQTLEILQDATADEQTMLAGVPYRSNEVVLHTDTRLLPKNRRAWASWNYYLDDTGAGDELLGSSTTCNVNLLQGIDAPETLCVTLNPGRPIDPERVLGRYRYAHPLFGARSLASQQQRLLLNGQHHSWFCGAWSYNGFHEDGIRSALDVVTAMEQAGLL